MVYWKSKRTMDYIGEEVNKYSEGLILEKAKCFLEILLKNIDKADLLDKDYSESDKFIETDYYLIYNRFVSIGNRRIDKRVVRLVNKNEIINELDENWLPGLEPNYILIPKKNDLYFGIYIQDSIYHLIGDF